MHEREKEKEGGPKEVDLLGRSFHVREFTKNRGLE
jgi:hypothetical protein